MRMRYRILAMTALAVGLTAAAVWAQSLDEDAAYIYVGTHNGSAYRVNIRGTKVLYQAGPAGVETAIRWETFEVPGSAVDNYFKGLRQIGVFSWQSEYLCNLMDGSGWQLEISEGGRYRSLSGSNDFPPRFDEMLRLTSELISRPFDVPVRPCTNKVQ